MNRTQQRAVYGTIYRWVVCLIALLLIFCAVFLRFTLYFTPENLENITLGRESGYTATRGVGANLLSGGIHKDLAREEIYLIEEIDEPNRENLQAEGGDDGVYPVLPLDMSEGAKAGEIRVRDTDSGAQYDLAALLSSPYPSALKTGDITKLNKGESEPLVLIYHTHATESYLPEGSTYYSEQTSFRSHNNEENMIAVGKVMVDVFNEAGIPTLHCQTLHDGEDYNSSYINSLASVKWYLENYPSIKYVFDVHRDAIIRSNGEGIKTECTVNGEKIAQIMTLVGTNAQGADHPYWQEHMNIAVKLQARLTKEYTGLARPINLRGASFNQQYAPGALLFEIGSCTNTLSEAKAAAKILATEISEMINEN